MKKNERDKKVLCKELLVSREPEFGTKGRPQFLNKVWVIFFNFGSWELAAYKTKGEAPWQLDSHTPIVSLPPSTCEGGGRGTGP